MVLWAEVGHSSYELPLLHCLYNLNVSITRAFDLAFALLLVRNNMADN